MAVDEGQHQLGFGARFVFAWVCFFKVLFDGVFAARLHRAAYEPALPPAPDKPKAPEKQLEKAPEPPKQSNDSALQLLALFQREGRFVDFLEEDVTTFSDADVGAAARVVHTGCRKALRDHGKIRPVRGEEEGSKVTVQKGTPPSEAKLIGNVAGEPPFTGTLRHKGWRLDELRLPTAIDGHDLRVIAPAEVEL
ncbi:MAG: DUF2760 domain-containing protein [Polyangiales bacterium]